MTALPLPDLADEAARLRPPTSADVPAITRICQDADIQRWTRVPSPYGEDDARGFVTMAETALEEGRGAHMLAVEPEDDAVVLGAAGLHVDWRDLSGEVGYWVAPEARRRGVAVHATRLLCRLAFDELGLGYLMLLAAAANEASNRVAGRLGFRHEGVLHQRMLIGPTGDRTAPRGDANVYGLRPGELR